MVTGILLMAVLGLFNVHHHNTLNSAGVVLYAFTSCESRMRNACARLHHHACAFHVHSWRVGVVAM